MFTSDVKESFKSLDSKPSFVWKDSRHKYKSTKTNNDASNRTRSKADYTDQHIGSRIWSKMHNVNVNSLRVQNLLFLGKSQSQDLQLAVLECKVYHNVILNTKSQVDFNCFLQLCMLDKSEKT
jgi:hypothetical protein